jgi:hypothetical protein
MLVHTGGRILDHYMHTWSSNVAHRFFIKQTRALPKTHPPTLLSNIHAGAILNKVKNTWWVQLLGMVGKAANRQLFYMSFVLEYKGMSRTGMALLSSIGTCLPETTYETYRNNELIHWIGKHE